MVTAECWSLVHRSPPWTRRLKLNFRFSFSLDPKRIHYFVWWLWIQWVSLFEFNDWSKLADDIQISWEAPVICCTTHWLSVSTLPPAVEILFYALRYLLSIFKISDLLTSCSPAAVPPALVTFQELKERKIIIMHSSIYLCTFNLFINPKLFCKSYPCFSFFSFLFCPLQNW